MAIVVAGGTRGIGLELALGLSDSTVPHRRHVVLGYSSDEEAAGSAEERLRGVGREVTLVRCDLSRREGADALIAAVPTGEPVACLVHSAVKVLTGTLAGADDAIEPGAWTEALSVNAISLLDLVRAARTSLLPGSTVLYLTSRGAARVLPDYASVGPAKALGEALVRYLAVELAKDGIRVNGLAPGFQDTLALRNVVGSKIDRLLESARRSNPSQRLVSPQDYVSVARFLASADAAMVTGQVHYVHGGADLL